MTPEVSLQIVFTAESTMTKEAVSLNTASVIFRNTEL